MSDECTGQVDETGGDIAQAVSEAVNSCNCRIMTVVSLLQLLQHHNTKQLMRTDCLTEIVSLMRVQQNDKEECEAK